MKIYFKIKMCPDCNICNRIHQIHLSSHIYNHKNSGNSFYPLKHKSQYGIQNFVQNIFAL